MLAIANRHTQRKPQCRGFLRISLCIGCPIACHAKAHGYEALLPYLCRTDHFLAETMHTRLIRAQTEALGGACCDYWYVGDQSPTLEAYRDLKKI